MGGGALFSHPELPQRGTRRPDITASCSCAQEVPGSVALSAAMIAGASWYLFSSGETVMNREQGRARARMVRPPEP
jgi:hypothetical protein